MRQAINWERLLSQHHVEFKYQGKNIYCQCPFCGQADSGKHMGISLAGNAWGCWRNVAHRGRSPIRLLMALLGISYEAAREIAGFDDSYSDPEGWDKMKHNLFSKQEISNEQSGKILTLPEKEFIEIKQEKLRTLRFFDYLVSRNFKPEHVPSVCAKYSLKAAVSGAFKDRVILPYYTQRYLRTWTGRSVLGSNLRYMDLSKEESDVIPKHTLYNINAARRPQQKVLLVCEGPFDALKLDFYSHQFGVRAVALSTNSITEEQIYLLEECSVNFERVLMVMDNGNSLGIVDSYKLKEKLLQIKNIGFTTVPSRYKDGGEMPQSAVVAFAKSLIN